MSLNRKFQRIDRGETEAGIEVTQGVKDGDIVIIAAAVALKDGLGVRSDQSGSAFGKAQTAGTK
jgi:hypothetical protein